MAENQVLVAKALQLSTNNTPTVRNITLAGSTSDTTLAYNNPRRSMTTGYAGGSFAAVNGNGKEATLTLNVLKGGGDETYLQTENQFNMSIFSGTLRAEYSFGGRTVTRIINLKNGIIENVPGDLISADGGNEEQSVSTWVLKFSEAT